MERDEADPRIEYCFPQGVSPSTAEGTFDGFHFYLRARFDDLSFTISRTPGVEAWECGDLADYDLEKTQTGDKPFPERLVRAYAECFHVEVVLEGKYEGSYLSEARKLEFIRRFCREFDEMGRVEFKRLGPRIR